MPCSCCHTISGEDSVRLVTDALAQSMLAAPGRPPFRQLAWCSTKVRLVASYNQSFGSASSGRDAESKRNWTSSSHIHIQSDIFCRRFRGMGLVILL